MSDPHVDSTPLITRLPNRGALPIDSFSVAQISGATSFSGLLEAFRRVEAEHRQRGRSFVTLDDRFQCLDTSGQVLHELVDELAVLAEAGVDADLEDDSARGGGAACHTALFRAVSTVLHGPDRVRSWDEVAGSFFTLPGDIEALVRLNRDPELVLDDVHVVQCLPTDDDADLLANIPNGYFEGDWTPFDCYAVVRRITGRHGYTFFGIGASTLGFLRVADPGERDVPALMADLQTLYGHSDNGAWGDLASVVESSPVLLLCYTERIAELVS